MTRLKTINEMIALRGALRMEIEGMTKDAGTSASERARQVFGFRGSAEEIAGQLDRLIGAHRAHRQERDVPPGATETGDSE